MKKLLFGLFLAITTLQLTFAQTQSVAVSPTKAEQEVIALSKEKWQWMADRNVDKLAALFDERAMFVHMGGSWAKARN